MAPALDFAQFQSALGRVVLADKAPTSIPVLNPLTVGFSGSFGLLLAAAAAACCVSTTFAALYTLMSLSYGIAGV